MPPRQHILIVGSGIAGLIAAIELSAQHAVTLVTKAALAESNTRWAQGGIAAAMFSDDSVADHIADTLTAGAGLCNPAAVEVLCTEGPARIRDLIRLGVAFDHHDGELAKGLEAAHSYPRVLHAGGDATGLTIETALVRAVRSNPDITVLEHTFAGDLILSSSGTVTGLRILDEHGTPAILPADAVILASGGAGQLFLHTTNPTVATGDGVAMALRAGAELADLEFYQFHPTALATPNLESSASTTFLISEAVRGEGATLLDNQRRRFMQHIHPSAELAPRDVVARGIARQMSAQDNQPVLLDITAKTPAYLATRFPSIDAATRARGLDWSTNPIPITPAAHYWMGGIRTDLFGRTSVPGLYAVGEVACTGVHGANRLASNSLLESLVFAWRCAHLFLNEHNSATSGHPDANPAMIGYPKADSAMTRYPGTLASGLMAQQSEGPLAPGVCLPPEAAPISQANPVTRLQLQTLMWTHAGIERTAAGLQHALAHLNRWHVEGTTIHDLETANLLQLARALVAQALAREESRGAHFREDFPDPSPALQHSLIYQLPSPSEPSAAPHDHDIEPVPC
jgi:L-aspartate oxidase